VPHPFSYVKYPKLFAKSFLTALPSQYWLSSSDCSDMRDQHIFLTNTLRHHECVWSVIGAMCLPTT